MHLPQIKAKGEKLKNAAVDWVVQRNKSDRPGVGQIGKMNGAKPPYIPTFYSFDR